MNICIPVLRDGGLESEVSEHFGSAPFFLIVDSDAKSCRAIPNSDLHHAHGMCHPVAALDGEKVDGIVVGGIGLGALGKLNAAGYQVFVSRFRTAGETLDAYLAGHLAPFTVENACGGAHRLGPHHGCGGHGRI